MRFVFLTIMLLVNSGLLAANSTTPAIIRADGTQIAITKALLATLNRQSISATAHDKTSRYEGYALRDVLSAAGVTPVEALRGNQLGTLLTVKAADGYTVLFSLAELDRTLGNRRVLLVDRENGQALPETDGPWRLVVPDDERPARWVRQIATITASDLARKSALQADLDGDGSMDNIRLTQHADRIEITVDGHAQVLRFGIDPERQDAICGLPAELDTAAPDCRPEAMGGNPLPGCKGDAKAQALVISDGRCDAIHLYWNHDTNALAWWRM